MRLAAVLRVTGLVGFLLAAPLPARAEVHTYALVSGNDANGFPFSSDSHPDAISQQSMSRINGVVGITADAYANFGTLRARAEAMGWQGASASFGALGTALWEDLFTITGGSGAGVAGVTLRLDGTFSSVHGDNTPSSSDAGYVHLVADINPNPNGPPQQVAIDLLVENQGPAVVTGPDGDLYNGTFQFVYGTPFAFRVTLVAYAKTDQAQDIAHTVSDFSHTALVEVLTLPPGAALLAASGTTYATSSSGSSTTTTSSIPGGGSTTSTTLPPQTCEALAPFAQARCEIDALTAAPLCGTDPVPASLDHAIRKALAHARTDLVDAEPRPTKKRHRLVTAAGRALHPLPHKIGKSLHRKKISDACSQHLDGALDALQTAVAGLLS